jgi:peptide chain release factor 1
MKLNKKDLKIEYTRGTGAGGQHKNKVETCVTITHIPTGMSERCQDTRYKKRNYEIALDRLTKRIEAKRKLENHNKLNEDRVKAIESQGVIRTYNFQRNQVKDHRTGKTADLKKFLDGNLNLL